MNSDRSLSRLEAVNQRLLKLGIREADISEQFIHSGGKGGQHVNKVSSAVRLQYGAEDVKCMEERSQMNNRVRAREILADRIEQKRESKKLAERALAEKLRKQKAGRPKAVKRRMLDDKKQHSRKKINRKWHPGKND